MRRLPKKSKTLESYKILNLAVILITLAFIIGTYGIYEPQSGFFHRLNDITGRGVTGHATYTPSQCPQGMISYWTFDEDSPTITFDALGNYQGQIHGATSKSGTDCKVGKCKSFDGVDDYVDFGNKPAWGFGTGNFTIEEWAKWDSSTGDNGDTLFGVFDPPINYGSNYYLELVFFQSLHFDVYLASDAYDMTIPFTPTLGRWYYFVLTREGNSLKLYRDGTVIGTDSKSDNVLQGTFVIGGARQDGSSAYFFNGSIDEVTIYNRSMTADEINNHYLKSDLGKNYCAPFVLGNCDSQRGKLNDSNIYKCLNNTGDVVDYITSTDSTGNMKCCPQGANWYTTSASFCQENGGIYYNNKTQYCNKSTDIINIADFACCKPESVNYKSCTDPTRLENTGLFCEAPLLECDGDYLAANDSTILKQCCSKCKAYVGKSCSEYGGAMCNITNWESCRDPIAAANDNSIELKCCAVACNTTLVVNSCPAANLCNISKGQKCPVEKWVNSSDDNKALGLQCCSETCQIKNCADLKIPGTLNNFNLCNLVYGKTCPNNQVSSLDTTGTSKCCKITCSGTSGGSPCGNGLINSGEQCDGTNLGIATCPSVKTGSTGILRCTASCQFDISGCTGGALPSCNDGIQNQNEAGVDCGGVCAACKQEEKINCGILPIGTRIGNQYCGSGGLHSVVPKNAKDKDNKCSNDYECETNFCQDGKCVSLSKTLDLIPRIWCWLSAWITYPASKDSRTFNACDCMCGFFSAGIAHTYIQEDCIQGYSSTYTCPTQ